jgi:hypothetical protein
MKNNAVLETDFFSVETAGRVAQEAVLQEIYLVDAKISREPLSMSPKALSLDHKYSAEIISGLDKDNNILSVLCNFHVAAFSSEAPDRLVMKIEASFCASYVEKYLPSDSDNDDIVEFFLYLTYINPISNAWPYWREFVQNMSSRMGFPALTVPLLEIRPKKTKAEKAKSHAIKKQAARRKKVNA